MSPGYSTKIYKKRNPSVLPYMFLVVILLSASGFIYYQKVEKKSEPVEQPLTTIKPEIEEHVKDDSIGEIVEDITQSKAEDELLKVQEGDIGFEQSNSEEDKISRDELRSIQNRALFYTKRKEYDKAIGEYSILLKYNKRFLTIIGMCYYWANKNEEAVISLKNADDLEHYPYRTKKFLAFAYYRLNDLALSLEYAEDAAEYGQDGELKRLIAKLKREENVMRRYKDLGTENFLIQFSREEHDETRTIVSDYLKEAYREIGKELDYFPNKQFVVILYNERDFFDVTRAPGWAGGLYDGKIRLPIRGLSGQNDILRSVIFHEFTHALISEITQKCPLWINEGLAEYFSSDETNLNIKKPIPLKYLEKRFPSGNVAYVSLAYRTSHSAVSYMIDKYGIYSMMELLENFGEGMDLNKAFISVLFVSYDDFVSEWGKQF